MQKISGLFIPKLVIPKDSVPKHIEALSRSQRLMNELGLVKAAGNGFFHIMPIAQRSLDKLCNLVNECMLETGSSKITMPILTPTELWQQSGRLHGDIEEFFIVKDRHNKKYLLSPTHEEAITSILATTAPISYKQLPLRLYQLGPKFRDELKARFGLVRAKEFLMKDLYSFDRSDEEAQNSYKIITSSYAGLFKKLQLPFEKVDACTGIMGGKCSQEFQIVCPVGEDRLLRCQRCHYAFNVELAEGDAKCCLKCHSPDLEELKGIEVAHTFLLGDRYTKPFNATYLDCDGKPKSLVMGCYGLGVSRVLAASLEVLSSEKGLVWPTLLAPYDICVIGPKDGSKEQELGDVIEKDICKKITEIYGCDDVVHDDRKYLTIGKRLWEAKRMGYPLIIVAGGKSADNTPILELLVKNHHHELHVDTVLTEIHKYKDHKIALRKRCH
ncbi:probable proline--tRNA ligase, mitochondrial [Glossina fuscipes]|uniref:Probable proline--tRNA ligase, mitochondrial n=1 Tax=Glossina fuscipes TaxID=7396 RepID=A0A9C5ZQ19_9MUSC|nr:probable proline--tRNA ligase, mitochondrial [Glossina fuscipes]